ncbi:hypothetical protein [Helicobacter canis]|uniref:hypothetical protein n=1 Tax=Helicobacter canis TaxID=29419 RepID=UPI000E0E1372|nr:hypothetical protein [Helicobacter canis]
MDSSFYHSCLIPRIHFLKNADFCENAPFSCHISPVIAREQSDQSNPLLFSVIASFALAKRGDP